MCFVTDTPPDGNICARYVSEPADTLVVLVTLPLNWLLVIALPLCVPLTLAPIAYVILNPLSDEDAVSFDHSLINLHPQLQ